MARWSTQGADIQRRAQPEVTERDAQKPDANTSFQNDSNKKILASAPKVHLLPLQLQARRGLVRRQMWFRTSRPTSRRPEVLMSDKAQPPDVPPSRLPILGAGRLHGARPRAAILGAQTRSDIVDCREARHRPTTPHGCERTDSRRPVARTAHNPMMEMQTPMDRQERTSSSCQRLSEEWASWRSIRRHGLHRYVASIGLNLERV